MATIPPTGIRFKTLQRNRARSPSAPTALQDRDRPKSRPISPTEPRPDSGAGSGSSTLTGEHDRERSPDRASGLRPWAELFTEGISLVRRRRQPRGPPRRPLLLHAHELREALDRDGAPLLGLELALVPLGSEQLSHHYRHPRDPLLCGHQPSLARPRR